MELVLLTALVGGYYADGRGDLMGCVGCRNKFGANGTGYAAIGDGNGSVDAASCELLRFNDSNIAAALDRSKITVRAPDAMIRVGGHHTPHHFFHIPMTAVAKTGLSVRSIVLISLVALLPLLLYLTMDYRGDMFPERWQVVLAGMLMLLLLLCFSGAGASIAYDICRTPIAAIFGYMVGILVFIVLCIVVAPLYDVW